jgi:hypothetical protein
MQLPAEFPHTRHEQYLVALPDALCTTAEMREALAILRRLRRWYSAQLFVLVIQCLRQGITPARMASHASPRVPAAPVPQG